MTRLAPTLLLLLAGCAGATERAGDPSPAAPIAAPASGWRQVATEADRARLRSWRDAWVQALREARAGGYAAQVAAGGVLLQPDAALSDGALPDGAYRCRTVKLGGAFLPYVDYPFFRCRVTTTAGVRRFVKETGSQRPVGTIYPEGSARSVFLGTIELGDERGTVPYGRDRQRDLAAWVERVGPERWRMVFPRPAFESTLDVLELVPG